MIAAAAAVNLRVALIIAAVTGTGGAVLSTAKLTMRTADLAMRMQRSGVQVKLVWISDDPRDEAMELVERLKMDSVQVERVDPWREETRKSALDFEDACDF